ncbi:SDR family NAD(P)-dependent oxidoreductase [Pedococcus sp. 5OH_020]|uniref:SDR family NAD(P)-dependent oxidoreductase n=1 Tax=Pedococcus sp. 5OH_020 TaxID=2989814 RepID=UPI0022E9E2EA|nr:SDR family NAD(P)-dependent oxidoreductase [Pedococcus sp. 5OH_020]
MTTRTVAITGAGSGIGQAITKAFLDESYEVFASDISQARLEATAEALGQPNNLNVRVVDVSDYAAVDAFVEEASKHNGVLDAMVNSAGVFDGYADVQETTPDLWQKIIGINLGGAFHGCRAAALRMIEQGSGRIITIGSVAGQRGAADGLSYVASKAGIEGMNRRLAIDVGPHNVTANVVAPGVIRTSLRATSEEVLGEMVPTQQRGIGVSPEIMDFLIPAKRSAGPDEVAGLVVFLASESAGYINGQVIAVDGGWSAT